MPNKAIIPFVPYIVLSVLHSILLIFQLPGSGYETKQLLMPALALAVIWSLWQVRPWPRTAGVLLLLGIFFSWLGDGAGLFFAGLPTIPMMIAFFALAHIAYTVLFVRAPAMKPVKRVPWWALIYAVWWVVLLVILKDGTGELFVLVALYGILLGCTAALSPRLGAITALGGAFFLTSDTFLALRLFGGLPELVSNATVMPAYTLGQGLIAYGVVKLIKQRRAEITAN